MKTIEQVAALIEERYLVKSPKKSVVPNYDGQVHIRAPRISGKKMVGKQAPRLSKNIHKQKNTDKIPNLSRGGLLNVLRAKDKFISKLPFLSRKLYRLGEKGSGFRTKGPIQDFYKIRDQCHKNNILFEDHEFPAVNKSLFYSGVPDHQIKWKRPTEIVDKPKFVLEGFSRFDVKQGSLGDCWMLAPTAILTFYPKLFHQVVPDDQNFTDNYAGVFHFRFWQYGRWLDVVIDDRLPTLNGKLIYLRSTEKNEFWSALLEKAYAKLHGSYEALSIGSSREAMEDFTGGLTEVYYMLEAPHNLYDILLRAYERSSLITISTQEDERGPELTTETGLITGHCYSVTCVRPVEIQTLETTGVAQLVRLRNPWGHSEWNGNWSDKSALWEAIPECEKQAIGLTIKNDGEFWMDYRDLLENFHMLDICNLSPESLSEEDLCDESNKHWEMSVFEGEWVHGVTAGGCRNFIETYAHNPQYRITLTEVDEDDDEQKCSVLISLMQKFRRQQFNKGMEFLFIGFALYHLQFPERLPKPLDKNFFQRNVSVARTPQFTSYREVSCRFKLLPGVYCIVPSTFDPNQEATFLLRVFTENKSLLEEYDDIINFEEPADQINISPVVSIVYKHKKEAKTPKFKFEEEEEARKARKIFLQFAGDELEVDWYTLKKILHQTVNKETKGEGFSKDICQSMVAMLDVDRTGKLGLEDFKVLWSELYSWKAIFKKYDYGKGAVKTFDFREALQSAGYRINFHVMNMLVHRYSIRDEYITFDDFVLCAVRLRTMISAFKEKEDDSSDIATFRLEEYLERTVYS